MSNGGGRAADTGMDPTPTSARDGRAKSSCAQGPLQGVLGDLGLHKLNPVFCLQAFEVTWNLQPACVCGRCWVWTVQVEKRKALLIFLTADISGFPLSHSKLQFFVTTIS